MPHDHQRVLGEYHKATPELVQQAIDAAKAATASGRAGPGRTARR